MKSEGMNVILVLVVYVYDFSGCDMRNLIKTIAETKNDLEHTTFGLAIFICLSPRLHRVLEMPTVPVFVCDTQIFKGNAYVKYTGFHQVNY